MKYTSIQLKKLNFIVLFNIFELIKKVGKQRLDSHIFLVDVFFTNPRPGLVQIPPPISDILLNIGIFVDPHSPPENTTLVKLLTWLTPLFEPVKYFCLFTLPILYKQIF